MFAEPPVAIGAASLFQSLRIVLQLIVGAAISGTAEVMHRALQRERAQREALHTSEERLRLALAATDLGIWSHEVIPDIMRMDERAARDFGVGLESSLVQISSRMHPEDQERIRLAIGVAHAPASDGRYVQEMRFCHDDGSVHWVRVQAQVHFEGAGATRRAVRVVGTTQDITERKAKDEKIQQMNVELDARVRQRTTELEAANKELEAFCYSVSHDLRAPLRTIDGFSQVVLEDCQTQLDAQSQDYLRRVRAGCQQMGRLIDALLQLSRVTRDTMQREPVDLSALAQEMAGELQQTAPGRVAQFHIADGVSVEGDSQLLRVALWNLFENAWKYSGKRAETRIEFGRQPNAAGGALFVRDNGSGFDMASADKLFAPFQRLHSVREFPGTGIGLALVARILHRHGGRIWAEAAPDQGATFYFTLNHGPQAPA